MTPTSLGPTSGAPSNSWLDARLRRRIKGFDLDIAFTAENETVVLFGPSGGGKSMTIKSIAGIVRPSMGRIVVGPRVLYDSEMRLDVPARHRRVGYVPQGYALFPHLTVQGNIAFPLHNIGRSERDAQVAELVRAVGLDGLEDRLPRQLSGGQQQRVALARALAVRPELLLLDEPFSALDNAIRLELRALISTIRESASIPSVVVTHDLDDAFRLGSRIIVIDNGQVLQQGTREDIFYRPASRRVSQLVGTKNILEMKVLGFGEGAIHLDWAGNPVVAAIYPTHERPPLQVGQIVEASVRPTQIMIRRPGDSYEGRPNVFPARIVDELIGAESYRLSLRLGHSNAPSDLEIELPPYTYFRLALDREKDVELSIRPEAIHIIDPGGVG
jgi:ABC-type sulfate/molybdate transport systems ATPase subunit